jgi:hypothetical protein
VWNVPRVIIEGGILKKTVKKSILFAKIELFGVKSVFIH